MKNYFVLMMVPWFCLLSVQAASVDNYVKIENNNIQSTQTTAAATSQALAQHESEPERKFEQHVSSSIWHWLSTVPKISLFKKALLVGGISYAAFYLYFKLIVYQLKDLNNWSLWQLHRPVEALSSAQEHLLFLDLLAEIKLRYAWATQTDLLHPLLAFYDDINRERVFLDTVTDWYESAQDWGLGTLMPVSEGLYEECLKRMVRLQRLDLLVSTYMNTLYLQGISNSL